MKGPTPLRYLDAAAWAASVFWVTLVLVCPEASAQEPAKPPARDFEQELQYLREQTSRAVGREALVEAYTELISSHKGNPRVGEAMLSLAALYEEGMPGQSPAPDKAEALRWFRRAAEVSPPGSELRIRALFHVAARVQWIDTGEARKILGVVQEEAEGNSLALARVEYRLLEICRTEGDLEAAEKHFERLMGWYSDPNRIPAEDLEKATLDSLLQASGCSMVDAWASTRVPIEERFDAIRRIRNRCPMLREVQQRAEMVIQQLKVGLDADVLKLAEERLADGEQANLLGGPEAPGSDQASDRLPTSGGPASAASSPAADSRSSVQGQADAPSFALLAGCGVVVLVLAGWAWWALRKRRHA